MRGSDASTLELRDQRGVALRGAAAAYPSDVVGAKARLDAAGAYERLLGAGWADELARTGRALEHVENVHGVRTRQWRIRGAPSAVELGALAARRCLERAGWRESELDLLVAATSTPEHATKCFAAQLGAELGVCAAALDVRGGGAGGLDAWITAALYLRAGARRALVVAVESTSPWLDAHSGSSALLFGDGAAALALERVDADQDCGLELSLQSRRDGAGLAFSVSAALPPTEGASARYRFDAPDAAYQASVAAAWSSCAREFAQRAAPDADSVFAPYAVTRAQVTACATELGLDPQLALAHLREYGALGCAGPLALVAQAFDSGARSNSITAIAVGGGVRCAALRWRLSEGWRR